MDDFLGYVPYFLGLSQFLGRSQYYRYDNLRVGCTTEFS
jgi:hypothetical protein